MNDRDFWLLIRREILAGVKDPNTTSVEMIRRALLGFVKAIELRYSLGQRDGNIRDV